MTRLAPAVLAAVALLLLACAPAAPAAVGEELVVNGGLELAAAGSIPPAPADWRLGSWGTSDAGGSWIEGGHASARAVRIEVTSHTEGDVKWQPAEPVAVIGGADYVLSDWYRSDVLTAVSVYYTTATDDGWLNLAPALLPASEWTRYATTFTMPDDAESAYFVHLIAGTGFLETDDYSLRRVDPPAGLADAMISLTFDDGFASVYENALRELAAAGLPSTQYVVSGLVGTGGYMSAGQIAELARAGHEIGSHTVSHADLSTLSDAELTAELVDSKAALEQLAAGSSVESLAYPYGTANERVADAARAAGYRSGRTVAPGYPAPGTLDRFDIRVQNVTPTTSVAEFRGWLEAAQARRAWLVLVYHGVADASPGAYDTTVDQFRAQLAAIADAGLTGRVLSVRGAVRIANRAPDGDVTLAPDDPVTNATLTASPVFADADGDALTYTYRWYVNGQPLDGATEATLDLSRPGHGDHGDEVRVVATATDDLGAAATATAAVTVRNSAPRPGTVSIAPADPVANGPLAATPGGFTDADGDALIYTYTWTRDGQLIPGQTGATLPGAEVGAGQQIFVAVTAADGHGGTSPAVTATVTAAAATGAPAPYPTPGPPPVVAPGSADTAGPRIAVRSPKARSYRRGRRLRIRFSCADASGVARCTAMLRRRGGRARKVARGRTVRLAGSGRYVLRIAARDAHGNRNVVTVRFRTVR